MEASMAISFGSLTRTLILSIGIAALPAATALAQTPAQTLAGMPSFASAIDGKNVRITADGVRREGRVTSLSRESLTLVENGVPMTIPFQQIARVERSTHYLRNGTLIGLAAGASLGVMLGVGMCEDCAGWEYPVFAAYYGG